MNLLFAFLLSVISVFLILLILVQRGRGGGLTGALGGMGGQSAFGTKAGDAFTRVTVVSATVWILTAILAVKILGGRGGPLGNADAVLPTATAPTASQTENSLDDLLPPISGDAADTPSDDSKTSTAPAKGGIGGTREPDAENEPE